MVLLVPKEIKGILVQLVSKVLRVFKALREILVQKVTKVIKVIKVTLVQQDILLNEVLITGHKQTLIVFISI